MKKSFYFLVFINILLKVPAYSQIVKEKNNNTDSIGKRPTCDCDSLWKKDNVMDFVQLLEKSTAGKTQVWPGYNLNDATFIVDAGKTGKGNYCLGIWKKGKPVSYAQLRTSIKMLTPLYSYFLNYKGLDSLPNSNLFTTSEDAPAFKNWMKEMNILSAVYIPMDFSKLPFTIPSIVKVQIAIHEAFHVEVMLKYWYTKKGNWPAWDQQPDRPGVQTCYIYGDSNRVMIQKELVLLANMMVALLDDKKEKACELANEYLQARKHRYAGMKEIKIKMADDTEGNCLTAESFLELEEGLADYGSWAMLFNIGMVSKEDLLKRYRAKQNDHFYLSGCMLMHAITLMSKESPKKVIDKIVRSATPDEGALLSVFERTFSVFCNH